MNKELAIIAITNAMADINQAMSEMGDCKFRDMVFRIGKNLAIAAVILEPVLFEKDTVVDIPKLSKAVSESTGYELKPVQEIICEVCKLLDIKCEED